MASSKAEAEMRHYDHRSCLAAKVPEPNVKAQQSQQKAHMAPSETGPGEHDMADRITGVASNRKGIQNWASS